MMWDRVTGFAIKYRQTWSQIWPLFFVKEKVEEPRKKAEDDDDDSLSSVVVNDPHQTSNDKNNEKEDMALQGDKGKQQTKRFNQVLILKSL